MSKIIAARQLVDQPYPHHATHHCGSIGEVRVESGGVPETASIGD